MAVEIFVYTEEDGLSVYESVDALSKCGSNAVSWIDIDEEGGTETLEVIAQHFGLHELAIEDCLTPGHFPKIEDYGQYYFMIFRGLRPATELAEVTGGKESTDVDERFTRKVALFLSDNYLITFRRFDFPWLDAVSRQVQQLPDKTIKLGTSGLAHRVIDVLIDRFQRGLSFFEDLIDELEVKVLTDTEEFDVTSVLELRSNLGSLKQVMRDQKTVISRLATEPTLIEDKQQRRYFKDIEDHALIILNQLDKLAEDVVSLRDAYFNMANVRLNDTMRVLAVIATIAAPLNIIVGLYGMNFQVMPFVNHPYGFWVIFAIIMVLSIFAVIYCKKKKWL